MKQIISNLLNFPKYILDSLVQYGISALTDPITVYGPSEVSDISRLKNRLKHCDVVLVCGNARISHVVKVLTLSRWSHVVLYVGDRRDLLSSEEQEEWEARYGLEATKHLVIDADPMRGVHLRPIDEYVGLMLRVCRPEALVAEDRTRVVDHALSQLGREYDIKHIISLLFFFAFPWELLPESIRRFITDFTLSEDDRICSRVLSEAFHSVGFPIRQAEVIRSRAAFYNKASGIISGVRNRGKSAVKLLAGGRVRAAFSRINDKRYLEIHLRGERHITPADYDLSRFFSIIKDRADLDIQYRNARALCTLSR